MLREGAPRVILGAIPAATPISTFEFLATATTLVPHWALKRAPVGSFARLRGGKSRGLRTARRLSAMRPMFARKYIYLLKFTSQHVPNDEYVELEGIIRLRLGKLGRVTVSPIDPCDKLRTQVPRQIDRDSEVDEIVVDPAGGRS